MEFLYQCHGEEICTFDYCLVEKQMNTTVMVDAAEGYLKTRQVSEI